MDNSSDLEFDNLLKNVKSTCKKKARKKNTFQDRPYQSCPQKIQSRLKLDEDTNCDSPEPDALQIDGRSTNSVARTCKTKTPKLDMRLLLLSLDEGDFNTDKGFAKSSKKVTFFQGSEVLASPKLSKHDNVRKEILHYGLFVEPLINSNMSSPKSPCQTPRQNLTCLFSDNLPKEKVNSILTDNSQATNRLLQSISELEDFKSNCQPSVDKDVDSNLSTLNDDMSSLLKRTLKTTKKTLNVKHSCDDSDDELLELTNGVLHVALKDTGYTNFTTTLDIHSSGKTSRKVSSSDTSVDENINQIYQLLNTRLMSEGDCDHTPNVARTPANKVRVPGLRDGYFSSTSRKTPKSSVKFLVSCLDDSLIEPGTAFNSFEQSKDNVMKDVIPDYSKPVPIILYTKAGVNDFLAGLSPKSGICNYDSQKYISHFEAYKIDLTNVLYYFFNKFVFDVQLPKDMKINWKSGLTSAAGYCKCEYYRMTSLRYCTILLSTKLLDSADKLRDTLIHELCHAAVHLINKEKDVHGPFWRIWTRTANLAFPDLPYITRCHSYKLKK